PTPPRTPPRPPGTAGRARCPSPLAGFPARGSRRRSLPSALLRPFHHARSPGQPSAEPDHQDRVTDADRTGTIRLVEPERDRGGGRVAVSPGVCTPRAPQAHQPA